MSIERAVTLLSPLFTALSGTIVAWVAANFPGGPQLDATQISAVFALGATAGIAALLKWLHGRQKFVQVEGDVDRIVGKVVSGVKDNTQLSAAVIDFKTVLDAHEDQIVERVAKLVHAPPSVEQVVQEIASQISGQPSLHVVPAVPEVVVPDPPGVPPAA